MPRRKRESALPADLRERLRFETLLSALIARFVNLPPDQVDAAIEDSQHRLCEGLGLDRITLWQSVTNEPGMVLVTHFYQPGRGPGDRHPKDVAPPQGVELLQRGVQPLPYYKRIEVNGMFPWAFRKCRQGETLVLPTLADLPEEAGVDRTFFERFGTRSAVIVPLLAGGNWLGILSFATLREERSWPDAMIMRFQLVAQVFANALAQARLQRELEDRLRFETLISDLSARMVIASSAEVDHEIEDALRRVSEFLDIDLAVLWQ
jgi:formate hydrogenlyase transcriptional activator